MAKYAALPFTRRQSERKISGRTFGDQELPNITGITSGSCNNCCSQNGNFVGPFEGNTNNIADITIYFNPLCTIGGGARYQVWMAPSGRFNNNCTNNYMRPLTSGSGAITPGVSSLTFNNNNASYWHNGSLPGSYYNSSVNIPTNDYGLAAFYKICITNNAGSGCSPWTAVVTKEPYSCNCTCPGGYVDACCCYDCNLDGISCCDSPPGNPVSNCCRAECDPGDPGFACGYDCPGGEICDTCYYCFAPLNTGACS